MRIDRLVLNNFISHQFTDTPFYDGITMIIGHNGAGKSSMIDAIVFALFGPKGEYVRGKKAEDLIKKGKMFASVELHFSMGENHYTVFRKVSMKKTDTAAYLEMNGKRIIDTISGVDQEIEIILGVSKDIFMNSVFVKQGEMDSLIDEDPAKRKELFGKLIGIDRLTKSSKTVAEFVKELESEKAVIQESIKELEPLKQSVIETSQRKNDLAEKLVQAVKELEEAGKILSSVDQKRTDLLRKQTELNAYNEELRRINSDIEVSNKKLFKTRSEITRLEELLKDQDSLAKDPLFLNRDIIAQYFTFQNDLKTLGKDLERVRKDRLDLQEINRKILELQKDHEEFQRLSQEVEKLETELRKREGIKDDFLHYTKQLEGAKKDLESQNIKLEELRTSLTGLLERPEDLKDVTVLNDLRKKSSEMVYEKKSSIEGEKNVVRNATDQLKELEKNRSMIEGKSICPVCNSELDAEHYEKLKGEYEQKEREYREIIVSSESMQKTMITELGKLQDLENRLKSRKLDDFAALLTSADKTMENIKNLERRLELISTDYMGYVKNRTDLDAIKPRLEKLRASEQSFSTYREMSRRYDQSSIENRMTTIESEIRSMEERTTSIENTLGFKPPLDSMKRISDIDARYRSFEIYRTTLAAEKSTEKAIFESIGEMRTKADEKRQKIDSLKNISVELKNIEEKRTGAENTRNKLIGMESSIKTEISGLETSIAEKKNRIETLESSAKRYERISEAVSKLSRIRDAFGKDGVQEIMRKDSAERITNRARGYVNSFGLNIDDMKIDENFDITVTQNGMEQSLNTLSGGEKTSLAIAVRLSIARYLTGTISTIIMDEPTTYLDEERRKDLKDIIQYSLKNENLVPQMIIITHHSDLAAVSDTSYEVTNRGGNSVITEMT